MWTNATINILNEMLEKEIIKKEGFSKKYYIQIKIGDIKFRNKERKFLLEGLRKFAEWYKEFYM